VTVPHINFDGVKTISWVNPGTLPTNWRVQQASSVSGPWIFTADIAPSSTSYFFGVAGFYLRIFGIDGSGNPVSDISNVQGPTT
jgi:hypothetical protein